ncbi:MAG: radical SAM protein [Cuspidothrix sp.]
MKIYQVEISNFCNLTCSYCPHPNQSRPKGFMSFNTFIDVIDLVVKCGQKNVYLHNFGEPLLHPELPKFISYAISQGVNSCFYTNGLLLDEYLSRELYDAGLREICISEHLKGEKERIEVMLDQQSIPLKILETYLPNENTKHDWARQVSTTKTASEAITKNDQPCIFEQQNAVVILWNGRINVCCIDVQGFANSGTVREFLMKPESYNFKPIPLCNSCNLMRGEEELT